jgi:SAM-dependent methyltransferase
MAGAFNPQSAIRNPPPEIFLLLGIFLTSAAALTLQISVIRLLSIAQGHHFAFLVVSMALLGYGASGSFLSSFPSFRDRDPLNFLIKGSGLFSISSLVAYLAGNQIPFDLARMAFDRWQVLYLFLFYLLFSLPFFFSGLVSSFALTQWSGAAGKIYFSDLAGASLGCVLVLGLFQFFGGPGTVLFSGLLGGLASVVFGGIKGQRAAFPWVWTAFLAFLIFWQPSWMDLRLSPYKGLSTALRFPGAYLLETHWSATSRVDVLKSPAARTAPGLSLEYSGSIPEQLGLAVDGDQLTAITRLRGEPAMADELRFLGFLPSAFPYQAARPRKILILEPKGGLEVLTALYHGVTEVVVVETNPSIVHLLKTRYGEFAGKIYDRPGVRVIVEDGRSFLHRSPSSFDLIVVPLSESLGASTGGIIGLQEDYRLTAETFQVYLKALRPGGFLSFSLFLLPPPRAELRLVSTIQRALEKDGKRAPDHLLSFRTWGTFSLLVKKDPLGPGETEKLKDFCREMRFDLVYYPGMSAGEANLYNRFPRPIYFEAVGDLLREREGYYSRYAFDLSPATDDRPFFHSFFRWKYWGKIYRLAGEKWQILLEGGFLVPVVFVLALLVSGLFILLPALLAGRGKREADRNSLIPWLACFGSLGVGFMLVEVSLIQKFVLFLGHPVYSVSLVFFSLLVSAGMGSRFSQRFHARPLRQLRRTLLFLSGLLLLTAFFYPLVLSFFQGQSAFLRWVFTFLLISTPGFFMGIPFPLAVRVVGSMQPRWVSWGWCANGCASVWGAILPVLIALNWGFQAVFFLAALCYLFGFLVICKSG